MSNTTSKQHLLFVVNPVSGIGRQKKIEEVVQENLDLDRFTYDVRYTERIHHGTDITREALAQQTYDAVVAVGGDGSVNDVVTGLQGSSLPMGIIPCGSGNGLARNLKIRHAGALRPHTHQPSPSIPRKQIRAHRLGVQCLTDPDCRRAVTALVPTIIRMGDHVSGRVRGKVYCQVQSGTRLTDLPYFSVCV